MKKQQTTTRALEEPKLTAAEAAHYLTQDPTLVSHFMQYYGAESIEQLVVIQADEIERLWGRIPAKSSA